MKAIKQTLETIAFVGYTALALYVGWSAHDRISPFLDAVNQVQVIRNLGGIQR